MKTIIYFITFIFLSMTVLSNNLSERLEKARKFYYEATQNSKKADLAIKYFTELKRIDATLSSLADTYIGSLTAVKARDEFLPWKKFELANDGIEIMEKAIKSDPNNIEALFIYGSTCYYLPFFFGKSNDAETQLKRIIHLLNDKSLNQYSQDLLKNVLTFIKDNIKLSPSETKKTDELLARLG